MVVIAIIAALIGLLIPAVMKVREAANRMNCSSNLKQVAMASHAYHDAQGFLPVNSLDAADATGVTGTYGTQSTAWSWMARLLPYIEQDNLYLQAGIPNKTLAQSQDGVAAEIRLFLCPSDGAFGEGPREDAADIGVQIPPSPYSPPYIPAGQSNYKGVSGANWKWGDPQWHN